MQLDGKCHIHMQVGLCWCVKQGSYRSGNLCGQGKVRGKYIIFEKSGKMIVDLADCRYL